jgi:uncharacterized SAM-binding protein YcdF (DUF218 family)
MDFISVGAPVGPQLSAFHAMIIIRLIRSLILCCGLCAIFWMAGLTMFAEHVRALDAAVLDADPAPVDAIVVLTGGHLRVGTGLDLLSAGKGKKLLISGVHPGLSKEPVIGGQPISQELRNCCIILGHAAESTQGNAEETQTWLTLENYHSVRLVTANYHMPRSLLLFRAMLPNIKIIPHPVAPENVILDEWWRHAGTASLLVTEYDKYLFAMFGLWAGAL